jgi:hypothetical protein
VIALGHVRFVVRAAQKGDTKGKRERHVGPPEDHARAEVVAAQSRARTTAAPMAKVESTHNLHSRSEKTKE